MEILIKTRILKTILKLKGMLIPVVICIMIMTLGAAVTASAQTRNPQNNQQNSVDQGKYRNNSLQGRHDDRDMRQEFRASIGAYIESDINIEEVVKYEFGPDFRLAEWNDIKQIRDIDRWIFSTKLIPGRKYFVKNNGRFIQSGSRVYFFLFSPNGRVPSGFLVHDKFAGKLFLGSWYGDYCHILASSGESYRDDMRRDDPPRGHNDSGDNDRTRPGIVRGGISVTIDRFGDRMDLNEKIRKDSRGKCEIADWEDLKQISDIDEWAFANKLRSGQTAFIARNGKLKFSSTRYYFVHYAPDGKLPAGFLAHDRIGGKLFLGSWYGVERPAIVKELR